jgi:hypothetical protein
VAREYIKDRGTGARTKDAVSKARTLVAQVVWLIAVVCAILLALGALLIALDYFDRKAGIFDFTGQGAEVKNALVNWGLGAVVWLVVGRILDRIIRP